VLALPSIDTIEQIVKKHTAAILDSTWEQFVIRPALDGKRASGRVLRFDSRAEVECLSYKRQTKAALRKELKRLCPTTIEQAVDVFEFLFLKARGNISAIAPSSNNIVDSKKWLAHFYGLFWERKPQKLRYAEGIIGRQKPGELSGRWGVAIAVAAELRSRNYILAPQNITYHVSRNLANIGRGDNLGVMAYLKAMMPVMTTRLNRSFEGPSPFAVVSDSQRQKLRIRATDLGFCTTLESEKDISWPFSDGFSSPSKVQHYTYAIQMGSWLRAKAMAAGGPVRTAVEKVDPFGVQIEKYRNSLPQFCDLILSYRRTIVVKRARERARLFLPLLDWLLTQPALKHPKDIRRHHIRNDSESGARTFRNWVAALSITAKSKNALINNAAGLFDHLTQEDPSFRNPVRRREDTFRRQIGDASSIGKTYRKRIPSYVLEDLRDFLIPSSESGFRWGKWVTENESMMINGKRTFCPLRPAIIALLATLPIRINQVCWLDSGEMDEHRFDSESSRFLRNPSGISGRQMGVLQRAMDDGASDSAQFDFLVSINKRPIGERGDYTIPYVDARTVWLIKEVLEWQRRYGLKPALVREADAPYNFSIAQEEVARELMPQICPLFRDPEHRGMFPPSYGRMKAFWTSVCGAYDRHNANWVNPADGTIEARKGWPQLSKSVEKARRVQQRRKRAVTTITLKIPRVHYRYDLYSLKVGGVSHLLDRGIPLAIVSAMAGQRTLSMTLRYFVLDRADMRWKLSELAKANPDLTLRPTAIEARLLDTSSYNQWLKGNSSSAMTALQHAVSEGKNFTISTTGICPGARCEDGLKLKKVQSDGSNRTSLVPGSLCGLCEFRVYGPPFLIGLVKEFNETLYTLTEVAQRQLVLRSQHRKLEAEGKHDEAIICRNEDEELSRRSEPDCAHMARLYEMITECVEMAELSAPSGKMPAGTLVAQKAMLRPNIEQMGQFDQWKEILEMGQILPNTQSRVPDQVGMRMQNRLMGILAKNGATPFLAVLPGHLAKTVSLEFARLLEKAIPSELEREEVFAGRKLLKEAGFQAESMILRANENLLKLGQSDSTAGPKAELEYRA
jgi:hypothetical protein